MTEPVHVQRFQRGDHVKIADGVSESPCSAEKWRSHPIYRQVQASSLGRIRQRIHREDRWRLLPQRVHKSGYLRVSLRIPIAQSGVRVNVLVAECWHGVRPSGMDAAHKDGEKSNNEPSNLMWCSRKANAAHRRAHGTLACPLVDSLAGRRCGCGMALHGSLLKCVKCRAVDKRMHCPRCAEHFSARTRGQVFCSVRCANAKLSSSDVAQVRLDASRGASITGLAKQHGVSRNQVWRVVSGRAW